MIKRPVFAVLCFALATGMAPSALAGDADPKTLREAQERVREGNRLYDKGDYEGARVAYEQSLSLVVHGATYRNLGNAEMKLGDTLAALKHLRLALSAADLRAEQRALTQQDFSAAYAATGHVAVTTSRGASVTVDGKAVDGTAPFADPIDVAVGKHTVEARLGSASAKADVNAVGGTVVSLEVDIVRPAPPPVPSAASSATPSPVPPATGLPEVPQQEAPPSFWNARREIGLVVAGAGVVALAASAYFYADGLHQEDRESSLAAGLPAGACGSTTPPAACSSLQSARDTQNADETWRVVSLGVGAAAVVVGAGLFFWPSPKHSQALIVPLLSAHGGGLQLQGEL
jgi:tetratricopeptide (TPR) repeat protein